MLTDSHEVFVCEFGVLQGAGDRNGEATDEGGIIKGLLDFCVWLEGGCLFAAVVSSGFLTMPGGFSWSRISMRSLSVGLGSFRVQEAAMGE